MLFRLGPASVTLAGVLVQSAVGASASPPSSHYSPTLRVGLLAFAGGVLIAAAVAHQLVRRHVRRVRAADTRAQRAERLAELGSMTRGLAHEIKNPLSTIGLNVQLLAEGVEDLPLEPEDRDPLLRRLGSLGREAERLRGILTDFLEYAGELRLETRQADLNEVIDELVDFFLPQAEAQGVRLRADLAPEPIDCRIDPALIKQAVLNLMLNAVQAMGKQPDGVARELIVRTSRGQDEQREPIALVHVIDTGPGIASDDIDKIFAPYFTTKSGGTGLGLPSARRIIEAHAGKLDIHSEPGKGTDFSVALPVGQGVPPSVSH